MSELWTGHDSTDASAQCSSCEGNRRISPRRSIEGHIQAERRILDVTEQLLLLPKRFFPTNLYCNSKELSQKSSRDRDKKIGCTVNTDSALRAPR